MFVLAAMQFNLRDASSYFVVLAGDNGATRRSRWFSDHEGA